MNEEHAVVVVLRVQGMMCQRNCGTTVQNALLGIPGCCHAVASFAEGRAVAKFRTAAATNEWERLAVAAVESVGFDARVVETTTAEGTSVQRVVHIKVGGMMCQRNCGTTVENALLRIPGCVHAQAIFAEQRAVATFQGDTAAGASSSWEEAAIDAIECVGFDAEVIENIAHYLQQLERPEDSSNPQRPPRGSSSIAPVVVVPMAGDHEIVLQVRGMSCAVCTGRVERALHLAMVGTTTAVAATDCRIAVVLANGTAVCEFRDTLSPYERSQLTVACVEAVQRAGYECAAAAGQPTLHTSAEQLEEAVTTEWKGWRRLLVIAVSITLPLLWIEKYYHEKKAAVASEVPHRASQEFLLFVLLLAEWGLSSVVQFGVGKRFYIAAYHGWCDGVLGMDFLVCLGTTASYVYSVVVLLMCIVHHAISGSASMKAIMDPSFTTGAMLISFVTLGKFLESYAKGKTASALQTLMELQPLFAFRVIGQSSSIDSSSPIDMASLLVEEVSMIDIKVGDVLRVLPGARIPTDGNLVAISAIAYSDRGKGIDGDDDPLDDKLLQQAFIDESALSGEPFPVPKRVGDKVTGSTVNQLAVLLVRVTAVGEATALSKIVRLMERAQRTKAPIQAYADRIACIFAPAVLVLAGLTFTGWLTFNKNVAMEERFFWAFTSAISVIVVACPCALGLATPTAVMVGTGVGATHGLLIKGGAVLENMHSVDTIVFDKTYTLTTGRAVLGADKSQELLRAYADDDALFQHLPSKISKQNLALWLAACAEAQSEHPLAKAIVNAAKSRWGNDVTCSEEGARVEGFRVVPGMGVECSVAKPDWGEWIVRVGSRKWTKAPIRRSEYEEGVLAADPTGDEQATDLRVRGQIAVYVSVARRAASQGDRRVVGIFGIVDPIKKESSSTIAALRSMGVDVWLCTGDHEHTAKAVAQEVGIDENNVCAGVSPEGKADLVTRLQRKDRPSRARGFRRIRGQRVTGRVAVVGDGINDAVALARADVGIAIGAGTEVAVEAADVVLVRSSLHDVVVALHLSKVVFRRIMMNFFWAMGYNVFALPFAAGVFYPFTNFRLPPELAGLMMAFSSVSVVTSSLLLRRYRRPVIQEDGRLVGGGGCLTIVEKGINEGLRWCGGGGSPNYENIPLKPAPVDLELV